MINEDLLKLAIEKWGLNSQVELAIEECSEFILAVQHEKRGRQSNITEEVADLFILMHQMRIIYGYNEVDEIIKQKMDRLELRLKR